MASTLFQTSFPAIVFPGSDVVLITSDKVELHLHRDVLRNASQPFRSMFSLPPPSHSDPTPLAIPEDATSFVPLVQILYKTSYVPLRFDTHKDVTKLIEVAKKYEFLEIEAELLVELAKQIEKEENPLRAWAIATRFELPQNVIDEAAARYYLAKDDGILGINKIPELSAFGSDRLGALISTRAALLPLIMHEVAVKLFGTWDHCQECEFIDNFPVDEDTTRIPSTPKDIWLKTVEGEKYWFGWADHPSFVRQCTQMSDCETCKKGSDDLESKLRGRRGSSYCPEDMVYSIKEKLPNLIK